MLELQDRAASPDANDVADDADTGGTGALKSIREACLRCMGARDGDGRRTAGALVETCENQPCPLWVFRFGRKPDVEGLDRSTVLLPPERGVTLGEVLDHHRQRRTAIRLNCLECVGFERREIAACTTWKCSLYPFRLGSSRPRDAGSTAERRALWHRIGHDAYVKAMNALLCSDTDDATSDR